MSPDPVKRRADGERNRRALLAAARDGFARLGPDASLDGIARQAGVANATLYRHFPTRADLLAGVYDEEVQELVTLCERLNAEEADAAKALGVWLAAFGDHVSDKGPLAQAIPDHGAGSRGSQFAQWHEAMHRCAEALVTRARSGGAILGHVEGAELLSLAAGIAMIEPDGEQRARLLELVRQGYAGSAAPSTSGAASR